MYLYPAVPAGLPVPTAPSAGVVLAVAATSPSFVVVVAPVLPRVEAIAVVLDGDSVNVTPTDAVTADEIKPLPVAVTVTVSPTVLSTRK
jgi:hypothetical protein